MTKGSLLAARYRILRRLSDGAASAVWLAEDEETGFFVIASVLPQSRARLLRGAVGLPHPHLAALIDLLDVDTAGALPDGVTLERGACVAVADWVSGATLYDLLLDGRMSTALGVRAVASIASAVSALHARGAVHGAISPRSIVMERADGGTVPLLTQGAVPADGSFCSLERIEGRGPSEEDDAWALHVVLYNVLTGRRPYRAKSHDALVRALRNAKPIPIAALDVDDAVLGDLIEAGLNPTQRATPQRVSEVETVLYRWLGEHGDRPSLRSSAGEDEPSAPQLDIGTFTEVSSPDVRLETPTVMPPPVESDFEAPQLAAPPPAPPLPTGLDVTSTDDWGSDQRTTPTEPIEQAEAPSVEQAEAPSVEQAEAPLVEQAEAPLVEQADAPLVEPPLPAPVGIHAPDWPVPDSAMPVATSSSPAAPSKSRALWLLWAVALSGVVLIIGVVWLVSALRSRQSIAASATNAVPSSARSIAAASVSSTIPPRASSSAAPEASASTALPTSIDAVQLPPATPAEVAACTARWFPAETFQVGQDLSFVCAVKDPRDAIKRMRRRVVVGSRGALTPGMRDWSRLGWYQLALVAAVRGDCCGNVVAFELPELTMCPRLDASLDGLARATRYKRELRDSIASFEAAAECAYRVQPQDYPYNQVPKSGGQFTFDEILGRTGR